MAQLYRAVRLDAQFEGHLVGRVTLDHQFDGTAFAGGEDGREGFDIIAEWVGAVVGGESVGKGIVERDVEMGTTKKAQT